MAREGEGGRARQEAAVDVQSGCGEEAKLGKTRRLLCGGEMGGGCRARQDAAVVVLLGEEKRSKARQDAAVVAQFGLK